MTFGVESHTGEAFQGVGGGQMCTRCVGDHECLVGVTCGLIIVALCDTNARACRECYGQPGSVGCGDGDVGTAAGDIKLVTGQGGLGRPDHVQVVHSGDDDVNPFRGQRRLPRCLKIAIGEARRGDGHMDRAFDKSRAVATGFDRGISRGSGARAVTAECQDKGHFEQSDDLRHQIVYAGCSLDQVANRFDCRCHLAAVHVARDQGYAALIGTEWVAECVGKLHPLAGDRLGVDEFSRRERAVRLSPENLAQPTGVVYRAGEIRCLNEVRPSQRVVV